MRKPFDAFFYESFDEEGPSIAAALDPQIRAGFSPLTIQESGHTAPPAPLISIRTQSSIPAAWFPQLRAILSRTTGYDHLEEIRHRAGSALALASLDEYCSRAVAEQAALLWLALLRKLPQQMGHFSRFHRDGLTGGECEGRAIAIFGVGRIGHDIHRIAQGLNMRPLGVDIRPTHPDVHHVSPDEALAHADIIVSSMNLRADNRHYFNRALFQRARHGAIFVNIARGELVATRDLADALDAGRLAGAGLDVFNDEPSLAVQLHQGISETAEARLIQQLAARPNVILTPHNAFNTREALDRKAKQSAAETLHFLQHGRFARPF